MQERPDGSVATFVGWTLIAIGVIAAFFISGAETLSGFWFSVGISNLGIGLGVLLVSLGYLVRAIWFLPGREVPQVQQAFTTAATGIDGTCEWCGVTINSPAKPCSSFRESQLPIAGDRVKSSVCKEQLDMRGHLI